MNRSDIKRSRNRSKSTVLDQRTAITSSKLEELHSLETNEDQVNPPSNPSFLCEAA